MNSKNHKKQKILYDYTYTWQSQVRGNALVSQINLSGVPRCLARGEALSTKLKLLLEYYLFKINATPLDKQVRLAIIILTCHRACKLAC